jgi:hypothetical protein
MRFDRQMALILIRIRIEVDNEWREIDRNGTDIAKLMRNRPDGATPESAEIAFSGGFAATGGSNFELFRYKIYCRHTL